MSSNPRLCQQPLTINPDSRNLAHLKSYDRTSLAIASRSDTATDSMDFVLLRLYPATRSGSGRPDATRKPSPPFGRPGLDRPWPSSTRAGYNTSQPETWVSLLWPDARCRLARSGAASNCRLLVRQRRAVLLADARVVAAVPRSLAGVLLVANALLIGSRLLLGCWRSRLHAGARWFPPGAESIAAGSLLALRSLHCCTCPRLARCRDRALHAHGRAGMLANSIVSTARGRDWQPRGRGASCVA